MFCECSIVHWFCGDQFIWTVHWAWALGMSLINRFLSTDQKKNKSFPRRLISLIIIHEQPNMDFPFRLERIDGDYHWRFCIQAKDGRHVQRFAFYAIVWVWHICFIAFYWISLEYSLTYRTIIIGRALKS